MGYNTQFKGRFKFVSELNASELSFLTKLLQEDIGDHPEWNSEQEFRYLSLSLSSDFDGIEWDLGEKCYGMCGQINYVIERMRKHKPNFRLSGEMLAQGEDIDDRFKIIIINNGRTAKEEKIEFKGKRIVCPHCNEEILLEEKGDTE